MRDTESSYMIKGGIIIGLLVSDITTTTACIRILGQTDTSDWIRFMSIANFFFFGVPRKLHKADCCLPVITRILVS